MIVFPPKIERIVAVISQKIRCFGFNEYKTFNPLLLGNLCKPTREKPIILSRYIHIIRIRTIEAEI